MNTPSVLFQCTSGWLVRPNKTCVIVTYLTHASPGYSFKKICYSDSYRDKLHPHFTCIYGNALKTVWATCSSRCVRRIPSPAAVSSVVILLMIFILLHDDASCTFVTDGCLLGFRLFACNCVCHTRKNTGATNNINNGCVLIKDLIYTWY